MFFCRKNKQKYVDNKLGRVYFDCMTNETPLKNWMRQNRWTTKAVSDSTGLSYYTVNSHVNGNAFPSEKAISKYKGFGIPRKVIHEQLAMMADRA